MVILRKALDDARSIPGRDVISLSGDPSRFVRETPEPRRRDDRPSDVASLRRGAGDDAARRRHLLGHGLNPDQLVALGVVGPRSLVARALKRWNLALLRRALAIIVCDEYIAKRVRTTFDPGDRLHVVTPWAHENHLEPVSA